MTIGWEPFYFGGMVKSSEDGCCCCLNVCGPNTLDATVKAIIFVFYISTRMKEEIKGFFFLSPLLFLSSSPPLPLPLLFCPKMILNMTEGTTDAKEVSTGLLCHW